MRQTQLIPHASLPESFSISHWWTQWLWESQVTFHHTEDVHSLGSIYLFPLVSWPPGNVVYIVCSRFLFVCLSFCRSILPFHFLINLSHVGAPVWPSPVTSSFTNTDCFPQVCGLIIHLPAVDILQPPGPVTSLFCWTFLSSQTLHSSHSRHLVHILI